MSNPPNPLADFQTYAYQHILIACSNTDVAVAISNNNDLSQFERGSVGGKYTPVQIGDLGGYVVLINGMTDAEFYIERATWGSIYMPSGTSPSTYDYTSIEVDGEITITEPGGMRFINVLANTAKRLKVATPNVIFLLKTVFVGQTSNGIIETKSSIRPIVFSLIDLSADFDYTGATYKISLVGGRDGYAKHPGVSHVYGGQSLQLKKGMTIAEALDHLMVNVNRVYQSKKQVIVDDTLAAIKADGREGIETYEEGKDFLPIEYVITYDPTFTTYPLADNDSVNTGEQEGGHTISFGPDLSIIAGINKIMETSSLLMTDTSTGRDWNGRNRKFTYKVTDNMHTTNDKMIISYEVNLYELTTTQESPNNKLGDNILPPDSSVIEFDYVYTGRNIDVLDFKMEMDMALAYYMSLQSARSFREQSELLAGESTDSVPGNGKTITGVGPGNTALQASGSLKSVLFAAPHVKNQTNKKINAKETNTARQILANFTQMATLFVKLKIAGNSLILEDILPPRSEDPVETPISEDREQTASQTTTPKFQPKWDKIPGYCKIKIMMPVSSNQPGVYEPFWYEGYYRIHSVQHNFSDGEFTQELELQSMPVTSVVTDHGSSTGKAPPPTKTSASAPNVPPSPDGVDLDEMSSREAFNTFSGVSE